MNRRPAFPGAKAADKPTKFVLPNRRFSDPAIILAPAEGSIVVAGVTAALTLILAPLVGALIVSGNAPSLTQTLAPSEAQIVVAGQVPAILEAFSPSSGAVVVAGETPSITQALVLEPTEGQIIVSGEIPDLSFSLTPSDGTVLIAGYQPDIIQTSDTADTHDGKGRGGALIQYKRQHKKVHDEINEYFDLRTPAEAEQAVDAIAESAKDAVSEAHARAARSGIAALLYEQRNAELRALLALAQDEDDAEAVLVMLELS